MVGLREGPGQHGPGSPDFLPFQSQSAYRRRATQAAPFHTEVEIGLTQA